MNKLVLSLLLILLAVGAVSAQGKAPKWMEKSRNAVVQITTFDKDNRQLQVGTGFFVSENGEVLASYSLLKGAEKAQVKTVEGAVLAVDRVWGADEMYDVIRMQAAVSKKVPFFTLANEPVQQGATVYLLPFSTGKNLVFKEGQVLEVSKLKDPFSYYKVSFPLVAQEVNSPLLLPTGEVVGLAQEDASGKNEQSYAVSAGYVKSLRLSSTDLLSSTYSSFSIKKAWPEDADQAMVALYLVRSMQTPGQYLETLNDYISHFPSSADGYLSRASHYASFRAALASSKAEEGAYLEKALDDIKSAARYTDKPGDVHFNRGKLIFDLAASDTTITQPGWSMDSALDAVQQAVAQNDLPVYRQLEGDIYFFLQRYGDAYDAYMKVNESDMASSDSYYLAAKALENTTGFNIGDVIALLDKAIEKTGNPPSAVGGVYLLERIDWKLQLMMYQEAITDYDLYYSIVGGQVDAPFYYYREQAKFRSGDLEGALADIQQALKMSPSPDYLAEEASVLIRMEDYDRALISLNKALEQAPEFASCYRLMGVCYVRQGKKTEACEALNKSKELGDPLAARLIREHCK